MHSRIDTANGADFYQDLHVALFVIDESLYATFYEIVQLYLACNHFAGLQLSYDL